MPPALLLVANLFLFTGYNVYRTNREEFSIPFHELVRIYVLPALAVFGGLLLLGILLSKKAHRIYLSLLFVLGLLTWVQGSFLMWDYGVLDARGIDWSKFSWQGFLDLGIWLLLLAAAVALARHFARIAAFSSLLLILLQGTTLYLAPRPAGPTLTRENYAAKSQIPPGLLGYSSSFNIVHIILDSFQTDVFEELVKEEGYAKDFDGFVLFRENAAAAPYTSFALPTIFSGKPYDGKKSPAAYYQDSIRKGFQNDLADHGFRVNLTPEISMREGKYDNYFQIPSTYETGSYDDVVRYEAARLFDVALFREVPHFLRKRVYNENNWLWTAQVENPRNVESFQQRAFFSDYIARIHPAGPKPAYHFIHLSPPHPPYVTLRDGTYAGKVLPNKRANYVNEARATLRLFVRLLRRLKKLGLYDSSCIVLQGDHGSVISPRINGKDIDPCLPRLAALLTIKPPHSSGPLRVSTAQTSVMDIPATITHVARVQAGFPGVDVLELSPEQSRERPYIMYFSNQSPPKLFRYVLSGGSVFDRKICHKLEEATVSAGSLRYEYGTQLQFGVTGNADPYMGAGWSTQLQMSRHCWNNGDSAQLRFTVAPPTSDIVFDTTFEAFVRPRKLERQRVRVFANGQFLTEWQATNVTPGPFSVTIPKDLVKDGELVLTLDFPDATHPPSIGEGADRRKLAIAMVTASLREKGQTGQDVSAVPGDQVRLARYTYGTSLHFGTAGNASPYMGPGWSSLERDHHCWNDGDQAEFRFALPPPGGDIIFDASFVPFLRPGKIERQSVQIAANGTPITEWVASSEGVSSFSAVIPRSLVRDGSLVLTLQFPDAVHPSQIGAGRDARKLAIAMVSAALREKPEQ